MTLRKPDVTSRPITRLFIANRGEILRRIATTANRLGIQSVALTDRTTPPAFLLNVVDQFIQIAEESPAVYLDANLMVKLAKEAGCDAVHPGFGFLSENASFASEVEKAGLIWVGPNPAAIETMASKSTARQHAERAGVPCIKGLDGFPVPESEQGDFSLLEAFAAEAGFPLLIKAAYGGGGKGMRQVYRAEDLREAALRARSEAVNSFGNGALICEQYLTAPRHVEVQIMADRHGNVFAIGDRDCSVQRRHQKIIEEAPAPELAPDTRYAMQAAATQLAREVGYDSAGTVEFLVDWSDASRHGGVQKFYFLEMNTRLQVEHPVTEEVFGLDLVECQLRAAMGEALPAYVQARVEQGPRGHSIEVRLYAEDVRKGFFPSPGRVAAFRPAPGPGIRWEVGLDEMDVITGRFDPMIAKLVATGATRKDALERLSKALADTFFAGPASNLEFLRHITAHTDFAKEPVTTHFLNETALQSLLTDIDQGRQTHEDQAQSLLKLLEDNMLSAGSMAPTRIDHEVVTEFAFSAQARSPAQASGASARLALDSSWLSSHDLSVQVHVGQGIHDFQAQQPAIAGRPQTCSGGKAAAFWYAALKAGTSRQFWVALNGCHYTLTLAKAEIAQATGAENATDIKAPVPGRVIAIKVKAGDQVEAGQAVFILESMKMEFEVKATRQGSIREVLVAAGDQVAAGIQLAHWLE